MTRARDAGADRRGAPARLRGISVERTVPFIDEVPAGSSIGCSPRTRHFGSRQGHFPHYEFRTNPYSGGRRVKEEQPSYSYEDEDQSLGASLRPGMRVKHAQFGTGTVISVEALNDDTKLVVRFAAVGSKTLRAKFARLELA
jgi:hypothetical protein